MNVFSRFNRRRDIRGERYQASFNGRLDQFLVDFTPRLVEGETVHLHTYWDSQAGQVKWRVATRGSAVCSFPGRCIKATVH